MKRKYVPVVSVPRTKRSRGANSNYGRRGNITAVSRGGTHQYLTPAFPGGMTRTITMTKRKKKSGIVYSEGKLGGFVKSRRKAKKYYRNVFDIKGCTSTFEKGGIIDGGAATSSSGNIVVVGHHSMPIRFVLPIVWTAIIKKLAIKLGLGVNDPNSTFGGIGTFLAGVFQITVRNPSGAQTTINIANTGSQSLYTIGNNIANTLSNDQADDDWGIVSIVWENAASSPTAYQTAFLNLQECYVHLSAKSDFKFQNRTIESAGDDTDSVDKQPLTGRQYDCFGYQPEVKGYVVNPFLEDRFGVIAYNPLGTMQEVLSPKEVVGCKKYAAVRLNPGILKTSVLTDRFTIGLNKMQSYVNSDGTSGTTNNLTKQLGKYRLMILEKAIQAEAGTAANSIKVAYEHNCKISAYVVCKNNTFSRPLVNVNNL